MIAYTGMLKVNKIDVLVNHIRLSDFQGQSLDVNRSCFDVA